MATTPAKKTASKRAAARSGNPATRAAAKPSSIGEFKKKAGGLFELPSGAKAVLHNPGGLRVFVKMGVIPNALMAIVNDAIKGDKEPDVKELMGEDGVDVELLSDMTTLMDSICIECFVDPPVEPIPADEADRSDDHLYVDELDEDDKMFVFQWVSGGTSDVAQFRREQAAELVALQPGSGTSRQAQRPARRR